MSNTDDKCEISKCKDEVSVYYYGHGICAKHWQKYAETDTDKLKDILGVKDEHV